MRARRNAVREVFVRLYRRGADLSRAIAWSTGAPTALPRISDLEVNNQDEPGHLVGAEISDRGCGRPAHGEHIIVATTRPETMLGDTGVAVHPDDDRYTHLIGKTVRLAVVRARDPRLSSDTFVDPEFGSGAVKVTPGHDANDFECGQRCNLPMLLTVIDLHGQD